jgi:hypothetical protein
MQTVGRVRAMWRTAANPVDVNIWADVPLHDHKGAMQASFRTRLSGRAGVVGRHLTVVIATLHEPDELMIGVGGVWLQSAQDRAGGLRRLILWGRYAICSGCYSVQCNRPGGVAHV